MIETILETNHITISSPKGTKIYHVTFHRRTDGKLVAYVSSEQADSWDEYHWYGTYEDLGQSGPYKSPFRWRLPQYVVKRLRREFKNQQETKQ